MASKQKTVFSCTACGYETAKWFGKCPECESWNTMVEVAQSVKSAAPIKENKQRGGFLNEAVLMNDIKAGAQIYQKTGIDELDRVLGGGLVEGALLLIGGDPGIGKSTLLLQTCANLSKQDKTVLYITGEESAKQIKLRAERLSVDSTNILVLAENAMDAIEDKLNEIKPDYVVIDSIQTMYRPDMSSAPGSVSQVRESAALLMRYAKSNGCAIMLVGHVTKEGAIAGPRVLEHMVDVVLYFEGDNNHEYRLVRAVKNRFGSVNELGVFEMTGTGMRAVTNASETLLSQRAQNASGSAVMCGMEGSRPMLIDIQALVTTSYYAVPRRTVDGLDSSRVMLLLAVLEKRAGVKLYNQDVFINVVGGLSLREPACDLAVLMAVASSAYDVVLKSNYAVMGEVGLLGEVRGISKLDRRITECMRLGFTDIICPKDSAKKIKSIEGVRIHGVDTVAQAMAVMGIYRK